MNHRESNGNRLHYVSKNSWQFTDNKKKFVWEAMIAYILRKHSIKTEATATEIGPSH